MGYDLRSSAIKSRSGKIKFRKTDRDTSLYHIGVWLATASDEDRDAVDHVDYLLHPSFRTRERTSANRANDFSITFWAWGAFEIKATVHFVDERRKPVTILHELQPDLPRDTGDNYEQVD